MVEQAISKRISVRKYKGPLTEEQWSCVQSWAEELQPLDQSCDAKFHLIKDGQKVIDHFGSFLDAYVRVEAPHYVLITSKKKGEYLCNAGFMGEQLVLKMANHDIGSCWLGGPLKKDQVHHIIELEKGQEYVILIGFGSPLTKLTPKLARKRKSLSKMIHPMEDRYLERAEALRLSPSAVNQQPWLVKVNGERWDFYISKPKFLVSMINGSLVHIDMGIGMSNVVWQGAEEGKYCEISKAPNLTRNKNYVASLIWKETREEPTL